MQETSLENTNIRECSCSAGLPNTFMKVKFEARYTRFERLQEIKRVFSWGSNNRSVMFQKLSNFPPKHKPCLDTQSSCHLPLAFQLAMAIIDHECDSRRQKGVVTNEAGTFHGLDPQELMFPLHSLHSSIHSKGEAWWQDNVLQTLIHARRLPWLKFKWLYRYTCYLSSVGLIRRKCREMTESR